MGVACELPSQRGANEQGNGNYHLLYHHPSYNGKGRRRGPLITNQHDLRRAGNFPLFSGKNIRVFVR